MLIVRHEQFLQARSQRCSVQLFLDDGVKYCTREKKNGVRENFSARAIVSLKNCSIKATLSQRAKINVNNRELKLYLGDRTHYCASGMAVGQDQ